MLRKYVCRSNKKIKANLKKKTIEKHVYHYSMCTLCNLCIEACPTDAIVMDQSFEYATYDRSLLTMVLNKPGSKLRAGVED